MNRKKKKESAVIIDNFCTTKCWLYAGSDHLGKLETCTGGNFRCKKVKV
jgi:hypothetical protein